ncbi:TPA: hypothetical protein DCX15_03965 [bacterium]|nr:hypothetical protein [bacterium]
MNMKKKILIVEDEYSTIEDIGERLKNDGYEVDVACDVKEAMEHLKESEYAVVLLDIMLPTREVIERDPEQAGVEILKNLKKDSPKTRVVVLTAVMNHRTHKEIKEYAPDEVMIKPVDGNELCETLKGLVERG